MRKVLTLFTSLILLIALPLSSALAHEGHKEASLKSFHGGIVKKTTNAFVEVVQLEGDVQIYLRDHDDKALEVSGVVVGGEFKDSKKKVQPLQLKLEAGKYYKVLNDTKNQNFFSLTIKITGKSKNITFTKDQVVFNLENQNE